MIQISQSPVLQALGYAIVNSLWQFALLWLIYLLLNTFVKLTAHTRYVTALLLQFSGFVWFVVTACFYYSEVLSAGSTVSNILQLYSLPTYNASLSAKETFFAIISGAELLLPYLSLAYLILIIGFTIKIIKAYRTTQHLRHNGLQKIDVEWRLFVRQISAQLGIKHPVGLYISRLIESPVTIGYLKPVILVPLAIINSLSPDQVEAILIHELAHIKRNDYLLNILVSIVEVALFFNPFMQLLSKQMKRERENSCDDWVLQYEYNACNYARALVKIATNKTTGTSSLAINAVDNRRALLIRVKRMIEKKDLNHVYRQQLVSLLFITATISLFVWFAPKKYPNQKKPAVFASAEPLIARLENPLFNPVFFLAKEYKEEVKKVEEKVVASEVGQHESQQLPVVKDLEFDIVDDFTSLKPEMAAQEPVNDVHTVNLVMDTALFKNYATRSMVIAEIKKLKKEFETLSRSSLFQNVDWKQFWDNTKVQKQLEAAFEHLKALENENKKKNFVISAVNGISTTSCANAQEVHLQEMTNKTIEAIVKTRIHDIKIQQSTATNLSDFNFNFDLPDFSNLNFKKEERDWSYTYSQKPRTADKLSPPSNISPTSSCSKVKPGNLVNPPNSNQVAPQPAAREQSNRVMPVRRFLKSARI